MAHSPGHRTAASLSTTSLGLPPGAAPPHRQQRRMTSPAGSLGVPDGAQPVSGRPPSPLRNGFTPNTFTGIDHQNFSDEDEDDDKSWLQRSPSPASSVSQLAANLAQRVGSFVGQIAPRSPGILPTEAELEAEAERERDRSRREAERILSREVDQRRNVEERVLAMLKDSHASPHDLPPPPPRSQSMPNPPSPSGSQRESWWSTAKNKLTPTKDPLTPAQQVIQEAKAKEKKAAKNKGKDKDGEWPANTQTKYNDPAFLNLNNAFAPSQRHPRPSSPSSPTPARPTLSNMPPNLTPSPMRPASTLATASPSNKEAPLLYAQFDSLGALDVHSTLLTVAKRFEKLEKWTVGHVRALEERMSDVERWLVDKEKEREATIGDDRQGSHAKFASSISPEDAERIKEELSEMQSRVGELGREMAKLATAPSNLSSNGSLQSVQVSVSPQTNSSFAVHAASPSVFDDVPSPAKSPPPGASRPSSTAVESTSPPIRSSSRVSSRTRLPYPTGDYAPSPDGSGPLQGLVFSPTNSPPSSITSNSRSRPKSISGLPGFGSSPNMGLSTSPPSTSLASSPPPSKVARNLPPPKAPVPRPSSVSPTPRKRYTVALGGPIVAPPELRDERADDHHRPLSSASTAYFSSSGADEEDEAERSDFEDETIGKRASAKFTNNRKPVENSSPSPSSGRIRAQSTYGLSSMLQTPQTPTTPLRPRVRSRSTDRFGLGIAPGENGGGGAIGSKFVDPLLLRKRDSVNSQVPGRNPAGKIPVGQLVAFFDQDKKDRD